MRVIRAGILPASLLFSPALGRWWMKNLQPRVILHPPTQEEFIILLDWLFQPPPFPDFSLLGDVSQHYSLQLRHLQLINGVFVCLLAFKRAGKVRGRSSPALLSVLAVSALQLPRWGQLKAKAPIKFHLIPLIILRKKISSFTFAPCTTMRGFNPILHALQPFSTFSLPHIKASSTSARVGQLDQPLQFRNENAGATTLPSSWLRLSPAARWASPSTDHCQWQNIFPSPEEGKQLWGSE